MGMVQTSDKIGDLIRKMSELQHVNTQKKLSEQIVEKNVDNKNCAC